MPPRKPAAEPVGGVRRSTRVKVLSKTAVAKPPRAKKGEKGGTTRGKKRKAEAIDDVEREQDDVEKPSSKKVLVYHIIAFHRPLS